MTVRRFDAAAWRQSPLSGGRFDLAGFGSERAAVAEICALVRDEGDAALRELGLRFDGWAPAQGEGFEVAREELESSSAGLPAADRSALEFAAARIRDFHERQLPQPASASRASMRMVARPVARAGIYFLCEPLSGLEPCATKSGCDDTRGSVRLK